MIKVNVGLSRKLSRDYQSAGYSINVEGEVNAPLDDPEAVIERIKEYYDLADEALRQQIERRQNLDSLGTHDEERASSNQTYSAPAAPSVDQPPSQPQPTNNQPRSNGQDQATPKQLQFIQNLAKRQRLSTVQLEALINQALGRPSTLHQLSKKEAGMAIDSLNQTQDNASSGSRR